MNVNLPIDRRRCGKIMCNSEFPCCSLSVLEVVSENETIFWSNQQSTSNKITINNHFHCTFRAPNKDGGKKPPPLRRTVACPPPAHEILCNVERALKYTYVRGSHYGVKKIKTKQFSLLPVLQSSSVKGIE